MPFRKNYSIEQCRRQAFPKQFSELLFNSLSGRWDLTFVILLTKSQGSINTQQCQPEQEQPGAPPKIRTIANTLEAKQAIVEGLITTFETGVPDTIGIAKDEALLCDMPLTRHIPATGAEIFGPFLVAGDVPGGFRSLSPLELERVLDMLCSELPQEAFPAIIAKLDGGPEWMEMWN